MKSLGRKKRERSKLQLEIAFYLNQRIPIGILLCQAVVEKGKDFTHTHNLTKNCGTQAGTKSTKPVLRPNG
ncbi:MAG: hypothetical protein ACLQVY_00450 [Limisphaerales bacterium]